MAQLLVGGYDLAEAASASEALVMAVQRHPALLLLDLPGTDGPDFIREALGIDPDLGIIVLVDATDVRTAMRCLRAGALDCVVTPFERADLETVVRRALERRKAAAEDRAALRSLKQHATRGTTAREAALQPQEDGTVRVLETLVLALEARSPYLRGHATRVADLGATIAMQLRLAHPEVETVRLAGRLCDVGMIGLRDEVLNKRGPLTPDEHAHVREHVMIGVQILAPLASLTHVADIVRSHHERWDGAGYPSGLSGPAIPVAARILHAADVFDALTSGRPYHDTMPRQQAVDQIRQLAGQAFDPVVVEAMAWAVAQRRTLDGTVRVHG
jgi:response regulator RpfG family c-di-GMP phosphodiesterase